MKAVYAFCFFILTCSCNNNPAKVDISDPFYRDKGWEQKRIPLIKPYEILCWEKGDWQIDLQTLQTLEFSIKNVNAVNIIDSLIIVHAKGDEVSIRDTMYKEAWFVIDVHRHTENAFVQKLDLTKYLRARNIHEFVLFAPDSVYKVFELKGKIDWSDDPFIRK